MSFWLSTQQILLVSFGVWLNLIPFKLADKIYAKEEQAFESESYFHELKGNNPILERENPVFWHGDSPSRTNEIEIVGKRKPIKGTKSRSRE